MSAPGFCTACGERLKLKRQSRVLPYCSVCAGCSKRFFGPRPVLIAVALICGSIGFGIGHYTHKPEPFYFIGTPVEITSHRGASPIEANGDPSSSAHPTPNRPEQPVITSSPGDTVCGAQTKSGRACRRRVKGGGYCWQHRATPNDKSR
jgi:hypothetical protein